MKPRRTGAVPRLSLLCEQLYCLYCLQPTALRDVIDTVLNGTCLHEETLSWKASTYLFPCSVQYSLVSAAILTQMYLNIGRSPNNSSVQANDSLLRTVEDQEHDNASIRPSRDHHEVSILHNADQDNTSIHPSRDHHEVETHTPSLSTIFTDSLVSKGV